MSSTTSRAEGKLHPMRCIEAMSVVVGPVTECHTDALQLPSLRAASAKALHKLGSENHPSHQACAQCLSVRVWASKAGSRVPSEPSRASSSRSGFLPPACGEAAVAILLRVVWSAVSARPKMSHP